MFYTQYTVNISKKIIFIIIFKFIQDLDLDLDLAISEILDLSDLDLFQIL